MTEETILLALSDPHVAQLMAQGALSPAGYRYHIAKNLSDLASKWGESAVVLLDPKFLGKDPMQRLQDWRQQHPLVRVIIVSNQTTSEFWRVAMRAGVADILQPPLRTSTLLTALSDVLRERQNFLEQVIIPLRRSTQNLQDRVEIFERLAEVGQMVTGNLDLDDVLNSTVDAAVTLTDAQEGSLLLLDRETDELYVRAERNVEDHFSRTYRLKVEDSLAGKVLQSGEPLLISRRGPQKIKTAYLVHALIYVPLRRKGETIGVLGVDHRDPDKDFTREHVLLVSALADFAAIAIENARLFAHLQSERDRLNAILLNVADGVVVLDESQKIFFINPAAAEALEITGGPQKAIGNPISEVVEHAEFISLIQESAQHLPEREEIHAKDGRFFSVQGARIPDIGLALTMHDISSLKELDRIKSEFVSTVSHDLRSPLTAVMGYTELLSRVGPLNERQAEFVHRVQQSVQNITSLVNELLDLGKIEAGFDIHREFIDIGSVVQVAIDELCSLAEKKRQHLLVSIETNLPALLANSSRIQQVARNLVSNAIKYAPFGARIEVHVYQQEQQVILQVSDNGPGIPLSDQPYIFDKFYRASNVPDDVAGTGLGLAIVKSIVEAHDGRVWVESYPGEGTTFTVVLPTATEQ